MPDPLRVLGKIKLKIYIYLDLLNRTEAGSLPQNVQIRQTRGKKPPPITSIWLILIVKYYWRLSNPKLEEVALSLNEKHTRKPKKPLSHPSTCSYSDPEGFRTVIKISIVISLRFSSAVVSTPFPHPLDYSLMFIQQKKILSVKFSLVYSFQLEHPTFGNRSLSLPYKSSIIHFWEK